MPAPRKRDIMGQLLKKEAAEIVLTMVRNGESVTMEEVASRLGVAKGTLYNYFRNKEALINHIHHTVLDPISESMDELYHNDMEPLMKLFYFIDRAFEYNNDFGEYFLFLQTVRTEAEGNAERFNITVKPLADIFADGMQKGKFTNTDPFIMAEMFFGLVIGTMKSMHLRESGRPDEEAAKEDMKKIITKIVTP